MVDSLSADKQPGTYLGEYGSTVACPINLSDGRQACRDLMAVCNTLGPPKSGCTCSSLQVYLRIVSRERS